MDRQRRNYECWRSAVLDSETHLEGGLAGPLVARHSSPTGHHAVPEHTATTHEVSMRPTGRIALQRTVGAEGVFAALGHACNGSKVWQRSKGVHCGFTHGEVADSYGQDKTRHDKAMRDKTRQDKTRQDKTRQDKTRNGKARQDKTIQDMTIQDNAIINTTRCDKTRQYKTIHGTTRRDKTRQDKTRQC